MKKFKNAQKAYHIQNINCKRTRIGKITCPRCNCQGSLRALHRYNIQTGHNFRVNFEVEHYEGVINGKRKYKYCGVTNLLK